MSSYNTIIVAADKNRITDGQITLGSKYIFNSIRGIDLNVIREIDVDSELRHHWFENKPFPSEVDLILVVGTPWLWHNFQNSPKAIYLQQLIQYYPGVKVIYLGIGACVALDQLDSRDILQSEQERMMMNHLFKPYLTIVRDPLAQVKLKRNGIGSVLLPDPSVWALNQILKVHAFPPVDRNQYTQVWYDPLLGISKDFWISKPDRLANYQQRHTHFNHPDKAVYCVSEDEKLSGIKHAGTLPLTWPNLAACHMTLTKTKHLLTGRVHIAVPALSHGFMEIDLLPIDSRHLTFTTAKELLSKQPKAQYRDKYEQAIVRYLTGGVITNDIG